VVNHTAQHAPTDAEQARVLLRHLIITSNSNSAVAGKPAVVGKLCSTKKHSCHQTHRVNTMKHLHLLDDNDQTDMKIMKNIPSLASAS
jgi:hypothetical protein